MKITLKGEPKSTGHIYRFTCRGSFPSMYMNKEGKSLKESYQWQAKSQYKNKLTTESIKLEVDLYFGTKRRQDIDNFNKLIYDALTGIVWEDDSQIQEVRTRKLYDKQNPRVEITIHTTNLAN